jgi:hypothetical protein
MLTGTQEDEEIIARVAALDIGKAEVMCCVRVPDEDRPGRRLQEVQAYPAMTRSLLGRQLRKDGIEIVTLESTSVIRGSKAKNWTLRRSCRGRRVRGGEAKSAATRGGSQMSATVGYLRRRRSCR